MSTPCQSPLAASVLALQPPPQRYRTSQRAHTGLFRVTSMPATYARMASPKKMSSNRSWKTLPKRNSGSWNRWHGYASPESEMLKFDNPAWHDRTRMPGTYVVALVLSLSPTERAMATNSSLVRNSSSTSVPRPWGMIGVYRMSTASGTTDWTRRALSRLSLETLTWTVTAAPASTRRWMPLSTRPKLSPRVAACTSGSAASRLTCTRTKCRAMNSAREFVMRVPFVRSLFRNPCSEADWTTSA